MKRPLARGSTTGTPTSPSPSPPPPDVPVEVFVSQQGKQAEEPLLSQAAELSKAVEGRASALPGHAVSTGVGCGSGGWGGGGGGPQSLFVLKSVNYYCPDNQLPTVIRATLSFLTEMSNS